jgi:hypothetical protein
MKKLIAIVCFAMFAGSAVAAGGSSSGAGGAGGGSGAAAAGGVAITVAALGLILGHMSASNNH